MYLTKLKNGHYAPYDTTDHDASAKIPVGEVVKATAARNLKFHKKLFALLDIGYKNQREGNEITSTEVYRKLKTVEAGFYDEAIDRDGVVHKFPHSLSFDTMGAEKFERVFNAVLDVLAKDMDNAPEDLKKEVEQFY
jgi:hypothetical protein